MPDDDLIHPALFTLKGGSVANGRSALSVTRLRDVAFGPPVGVRLSEGRGITIYHSCKALRRTSHDSGERRTERARRLKADRQGDLADAEDTIAQLVLRKRHSPMQQVLDRPHTHDLLEPASKR